MAGFTPDGKIVAMIATPRPRRFYDLPSFVAAQAAFAPLDIEADVPPSIAAVVRRIDDWNTTSAARLQRVPQLSPARRFLAVADVVSTCLKLIRATDTVAIHEWHRDPGTDPIHLLIFARVKAGFLERYDALIRLLGEVATEADIARPSDVGNLRSLASNTRKLMQLLGTENLAGRVAVVVSLGVFAWRERVFLLAVFGRLLRSNSSLPFGRGNRRLARRINTKVGFAAVDYTRAEDLRQAHRALRSRGVRGAAADEWIVRALRLADAASGRAWKGLLRLTELIHYGDLDPTAPDFGSRLSASMTDGVHYTHVPGGEVVVRDYRLGAMLAVLDAKVDKATGRVALTQGGGSVVPGMFRHSQAGIEAGRKYLKPLDRFMRSMVTADGEVHKTQKGAFNRYFGWGPVLDTAPFVEATLRGLLDRAAEKAAAQGGVFDFKMDLAFHFPIAVICHMLGIAQADAPRVQGWTEDFVRALDAGTGISPGSLAAGNRATRQLEDHLRDMIRRAREGGDVDGIIGDLARKTLPFDDDVLLANLIVLIFAGFETTTGLLCMGINELLQRPEQWSYLRSRLVEGAELEVDGETVRDSDLRWSLWAFGAVSLDPANRDRVARLQGQLAKAPALAERREALEEQERCLEAAVEEMLRYTAPGSVIPLAVNEDLVVTLEDEVRVAGRVCPAGETIRFEKGQIVNVAVDELNRRCPMGSGRFDAGPNGQFDISRDDNKHHLSFGRAHSCIGARLATENMKRALQAVLQRFPDLERAGQPQPQQFDLFNGLAALPVRIGRATASARR
jgi:cytochrome P450